MCHGYLTYTALFIIEMEIFPMRHLVMLPPLLLHMHSSSSVVFCACIILLSFFWVKKKKEEERREKKKGCYEGEVALASKVKLLQHGRGD